PHFFCLYPPAISRRPYHFKPPRTRPRERTGGKRPRKQSEAQPSERQTTVYPQRPLDRARRKPSQGAAGIHCGRDVHVPSRLTRVARPSARGDVMRRRGGGRGRGWVRRRESALAASHSTRANGGAVGDRLEWGVS